MAFAALGGLLLIGLLPVNRDFEPAEAGIRIYLVSNTVHADIIVPRDTAVVDWGRQFAEATFEGSISRETHVAFGWGDKGFFLETETWDDLRLTTAASAMFLPTDSCVHVAFTRPGHHPTAVAVNITETQYARLVDFIQKTFQTNGAGDPVQIPGNAYGTTDAFFVAEGRYHFLNTCNSWVGRGLREAGVTVPWFSPLPKTPLLYIESE